MTMGGAEYLDVVSGLEARQSYLYSVRAFGEDGGNIGKWTAGVRSPPPANCPALARSNPR